MSQANPSPGAKPGGNKMDRRELLVVAVIAVAGVVVAGAFVWSLGNSPAASWSPSFAGVWSMPGADLGNLNRSESTGTAAPGNDSLWFSGSAVDLVAYLSPADHDMALVVQGMANPTVHVPAGARITITAVNMDPDEYHNWALTRTGPPYGSMPMMGSGAMMSMAMLGPASGGNYPSQSLSFTAQAGTYWYLCEVAGHAAAGMYGAFVVG